jgi:hypothetical protein
VGGPREAAGRVRCVCLRECAFCVYVVIARAPSCDSYKCKILVDSRDKVAVLIVGVVVAEVVVAR